MTYEQIINDDTFFNAVWCNPSNARYKLLLDNGYSNENIDHMFEVGTMFNKVKELVVEMTPEERLSFYTWEF
ncbi:hypothetical protein [Oceanobacillus sp. FSL H7-0719]|uniref:hypothetical protein n=1 Tax=Oceanobacillus sp. FSL H7-0719 TaxID=2954507 RepID=UPI003253A57D